MGSVAMHEDSGALLIFLTYSKNGGGALIICKNSQHLPNLVCMINGQNSFTSTSLPGEERKFHRMMPLTVMLSVM